MFRRFAAVAAALMLVVGFPAAPARAATPADTQFAWLVDASARLPVPAAELAQHLDQEMLTAIGGADGFNDALRPLAPFTPGAVVSSSPTQLRRLVSGPAGPLLATLTVDRAGLLAGLFFSPYLPAPTTWNEIDGSLRTLAPRVSFAAMRISPAGCRLVHGREADAARPLGSAFKLYVLGAVAEAVGSGRLSWTDRVPLKAAWKSLPSGVLQNEPDGTVHTLAEYADYMISISDNTATDHLIHTVGRDAVQRQFTRFGNTAANAPVLTTREFFALKGWRYPAAAAAYVALPPALRARTLPALDRVPLTAITPWQTPRMIDKVEWFGSPVDMCQAYAGLWARHDPAVNTALTMTDAGLGLPSAEFPTVWFKGGAEPGVLTFNYLARTADGALLTASLMLSDPVRPLPEATVAPQVTALLRGALQLAAAD
ncbi:serine hydrolase [Amorphoplanes nipponensis]|uniref:Serine hydrolase n=1 Tax=Actinoplanes nipponensis TaxID=135950 RepID=A0A919MPN2_9ACTN|nr:serine hydrolase [Actinoplanes nipponensis]GIE52776.1 serine hydrolase [Actinoplanes nipponensis]